MYTECVLGIIVSCFIYYDSVLLMDDTLYLMVFAVGVTTSMNFIARVLRQYRIYVSTYIENGRESYDHILKSKKRLKNSWNIIIICAYGACIMITNFFSFAETSHLTMDDEFKFLTTFLGIEKGIELGVEIFCYFLFMKRWINKAYRIEAGILIFLQSILVIFLAAEHLELFLKSGILPIQKIFSVVFLDSYILRLITKECHKKPLYPPIYIIDSAMYITEIRLVHDSFIRFVESQNNEE